MKDFIILYCLLICGNCLWGYLTYLIGYIKGIKGFWLGFFLNIIGVIVVLCIPCRKKCPNQTIIFTHEENKSKVDNKFDNYLESLTLIEKLSKLKNSGAITEEEFENEKRKILR